MCNTIFPLCTSSEIFLSRYPSTNCFSHAIFSQMLLALLQKRISILSQGWSRRDVGPYLSLATEGPKLSGKGIVRGKYLIAGILQHENMKLPIWGSWTEDNAVKIWYKRDKIRQHNKVYVIVIKTYDNNIHLVVLTYFISFILLSTSGCLP